MTLPELDALLLAALRSLTAGSGEVLFLTLFGSLILGTAVQLVGFKVIIGTLLESKNRAWYVLGVPMVVLAYWVYWLAIRTLPHFH